MNKQVIIIGNGGHAKVIADIVKQNGDLIKGFIVDQEFDKTNVLGINYLGDFTACNKYKSNCEFIIAIGDNTLREKYAKSLDVKWYTGIHPRSTIDITAKIGIGTCVMANAVLNSCAIVGNHCIINTGSIVEHDVRIGDFTHLSPNATICGFSSLGNKVHVGVAATIINKIDVTNNVVIGAGSCVIKSIDQEGTYVGIPAMRVKK
ncbi:MAG: acetyltransferase [Anaerorhabdus sp.]|uniref:acetyltransferase n=1 Tax=Anaerorhabdus sp. TaxID=1872524 RepID=UPI002FC7E586